MKTFFTALLVALIAIPAYAADFKKGNPNNPVVIMKTNHGDIYLELFADEAPKTVSNFIGLAQGTKEWTDPATNKKVKKPLYDGLIFHRVIKDFMIQGGDPLGTGKGGPGYKFEDEISANSLGLDRIKVVAENGQPNPMLMIRTRDDFQRKILMPVIRSLGIKSQEEINKRIKEIEALVEKMTLKQAFEHMGYKYDDKLKSHPPKKGFIAMANSGPDTNGSQFFINLIDTPWLSGKHTVFGRVIKGMDVVEKIGNVKVTSAGSKPEKAVKIISIRKVKEK